MKEKNQRALFDYLMKSGIENFIGVPDSTMKYFIDQGIQRKKIIISTREEEAIGVATGMYLSSSPSLVFMQNAGFGNSIGTITSLTQLYQIPIIFLIGWRGYLKDDAPEHIELGKIQPKLIELLGIKSKVLSDQNWKKTCDWVITQIEKKKSVMLIIKRDFHE